MSIQKRNEFLGTNPGSKTTRIYNKITGSVLQLRGQAIVWVMGGNRCTGTIHGARGTLLAKYGVQLTLAVRCRSLSPHYTLYHARSSEITFLE